MSNKDMPAMPISDSGFGQYKPEVFYGLTKREMLAMNAPDVPEWFITKFKNKATTTLVYNPKTGHNDKLCELDKEMIYFKWRWYYADMMLD